MIILPMIAYSAIALDGINSVFLTLRLENRIYIPILTIFLKRSPFVKRDRATRSVTASVRLRKQM